jgi:serine/threonine-protein kinase
MTEVSSIGLGAVLSDRYELVAELALGAMGTVYVAVDRVAGDRVAVKVLHAEYLTHDAMRRRFRREGAALKALDHPAIVRLLDLGIEDTGLVYLVTEYVQGETLAARLESGSLRIEEADLLIDTMCGGIDAAHRHGILHGDLKPANVLWGSTPRLVDFGASKVLGLDRLTATGEISGTPAYMAPEVFTGAGDVDERIDVYGLGVLAYHALGGQPPFAEGHVGRLLMKIDAGDCLPLDAIADVPPALAEVVGRAMHRRKEQRYRSVTELLDAWRGARS